MSQYTAAVIGTGPEPDNPVWGESAAMAYRHGVAYRDCEASDLVGCADIVRENAADFAVAFDLPDSSVYEDHETMLAELEPDVVSICTPVPTHADLVVSTVESGVPLAVHCEKPMAHTWAESQRMAAVAADADVQLTFNHQRRFGPQWVRARDLLESGAIGDLERVEVGGKNLFDYGSHLIDLANAFAGERGAEWVFGQVHYTEADVRYGVHNENQALACWGYGNGVHALASTGHGSGADLVGCEQRLLATAGTIEINPDGTDASLRYRADETDGWREESPDADCETPLITLAIEDVLAALDSGREPETSAAKALRATEIIFAAWASARRRERLSLPLEDGGNALTELVDAGELTPDT
ncbi:Gfo/Idh/MocA family protein [Natronobiforma cellulositropha]|uniref:Gfo/Idh/MocA family protein n=1 Tax=Natronobiforma cellulositropha TaxID=1679076 RepID=UPI0021D57CF9|nr:Gfo/Idh/MocA family oxidoreductase [Natronobiforma cellulositropha]